MDIFVVKPKFSPDEELAIRFAVHEESTILEGAKVKRLFYFINTDTFVREEEFFRNIEDFRKLKGFDIEDFVDKSEKNLKLYKKIYNLLTNLYFSNIILNNMNYYDIKFMLGGSLKEDKISEKEEEIKEVLLNDLKKVIPPYYVRYYQFMEEYKTIKDWEKFYNTVIEDLSSFVKHEKPYGKNLTKTSRRYRRLDFLSIIKDDDNSKASDELKYDLKTYFTEPS